jgi:GT2 family glycosyltransferase
MAVELAVVVPVRDRVAELDGLLDALAGQTLPRDRFEVVIAADGTPPGALAGLDARGLALRVVHGPARSSYAARNRGARAVAAAVLAFTDSDCRPEPGWLEAGLVAMRYVDLAAGLIRLELPRRPSLWSLLDADAFLDQRRAMRAGAGMTANLFVRREMFEKVGGMDETLASNGDHDFVRRCRAAGATRVFTPHAVVRHPARAGALEFLRKWWLVHHCDAVRQGRNGRRPRGVRLAAWVPVIATWRSRRWFGRSMSLDRRRLQELGVRARPAQHVAGLVLIYLVLPYLAAAAQLAGWRASRRST